MHSRRNTNVCEGFFGSIKYYEDRFHCSLAGANGVTSSKADEIFVSRKDKRLKLYKVNDPDDETGALAVGTRVQVLQKGMQSRDPLK